MPRPIQELREPSNLLGILFDVDDTVTWEGKLVPEALQAMQDALIVAIGVGHQEIRRRL